MILLLVWLVPALTFIHPFRQVVLGEYKGTPLTWVGAVAFALFWPLWVLCWLRVLFLQYVAGVTK